MKLPSRIVSFVAELRRRRVLQATAVYATAAFVAVQVAAVAFPALRLPDGAQTLVVVLAVVGFPVVAAVSWAYELTSEGLRRTVEEGGDAEVVHARGTPWISLSLVVVVTAMSAGIGWVAWDVWLEPAPGAGSDAPPRASAPSPNPARVVVLPFRGRSGEADRGGHVAAGQDRSGEDRGAGEGSDQDGTRDIAEGLTADLIHELNQVAALDVVSERGVLPPFRDRELPLDSVARDVGAGSVVEGAVESVGDSVRVTVQLRDAETGEYLMSRRVVRSRDSLLALRDEIVEGAARQLRRRVGEEVQLERHRAGTRDDRAWELFHRAERLARKGDELRFSGQRELAGRFYVRADSLYEAAGKLDGEWPAPGVARGWLAYKRSRLPGFEIEATEPEWLRAGLEHAEGVLGGNPGHAGALELRGVLLNWLSRVPGGSVGPDSVVALRERAKEDLQTAVARDPDRARAWVELSNLLRSQGRFAEAREAWRHSRQADAFLSNDGDVVRLAAHLSLELGELETALRWLRKARRFYPEDPRYPALELLAHATAGAPRVSPDSVWDVLETFEGLMGSAQPRGRMWVAATLARLGLQDSARAVLRRARTRLPPDPPALAEYYEANVWYHLGRRERTIEILARYIEAHPEERPYVSRDIWWHPLHGHSAFQALVSPSDTTSSGE